MIEVRERVTERINRQRLKLEARRSGRPVVVIAIGLLIAFACWSVIFKNVGRQVYSSTNTVSFAVGDAAGVIPSGRQEARFKGVPAGVIDEVELVGGRPVITVKLYAEFGDIYRDARAALRPNTALEDMYLDILDRGSPSAGIATADEPLAPSQTRIGVQPEDVLDTFSPDVRANVSSALRELGGGLDGRGELLRASLVELRPFLDVATRLADQLRRRGRLMRRLVHDTAELTGELARRERALRRLTTEGGATLRTLEASGTNLDATLAELPSTLAAVDSSFGAVRRVLPEVDRALTALRPVVDELPQGLRAIRDLNGTARPAVRALQRPVRSLVPLTDVLRPLSADLRQAITRLRPQVGAIDHATESVAGCSTALQGFFQWTPSVVKWGDARGLSIRGDVVVSASSGGGAVADPMQIVGPSCAPGTAIGGEPGPGGRP